MASKTKSEKFELNGGALCLDFVNTVDDRPMPFPKELLENYEDLLDWSFRSGALPRRSRSSLEGAARARPSAARKSLDQARHLRERLFALFAGPPRSGALITRELQRAYRSPLLRRSRAGFTLEFRDDEDALDGMIGPIVRSTAELLASEDLSRVRVCASQTCDWLFLDESRNRSRQWCDMAVCGNRAKAQRYYQRRKDGR